METQLSFDLTTQKCTSGGQSLTPKQFWLLAYLALRRTDGTDGWVEREEIAQRVYLWRQQPQSVGKEISRYDGQPWFHLIEYGKITRGPYRLIPAFPVFVPSRDAAVEKLTTPPRLSSITMPTLDPLELKTYDLIAQYGFYIPAVIDLIRQRLGDPSAVKDPAQQVTAYRILATINKNRGNTGQARAMAQTALKIAQRHRLYDDVAYLLDQIAGTYHIEGHYQDAQIYFEQEIDFLNAWESPKAHFHLVGAYRGLAGTLRHLGETQKAQWAIRQSKVFAEKSNNTEGLRIAQIEETRLAGKQSPKQITQLLSSQPSEHIIARIMSLGVAAENLLTQNVRPEGDNLLQAAMREAERFQLPNQVRQLRELAKRYEVALKS